MRKGTTNTAYSHSLPLQYFSLCSIQYICPTLVVTQLLINAPGVVLYNLLAILFLVVCRYYCDDIESIGLYDFFNVWCVAITHAFAMDYFYSVYSSLDSKD